MEKDIDVEKELLREATERQKKHKLTAAEIAFRKDWEKRTKHVCKPCWELKYCPYGSLVEQFPLPGPTKKIAMGHNEFLKEQLARGAYKGWRKKIFEKEVAEFNANECPEKHSKETFEKACNVFGHMCPVFFVNEPLTETLELRRISRYIPRGTMLRVVRRDSYICQICGMRLRDNELEFDHKIPISKGGSGEENNIQLTCISCNRTKSNKA